MTKKFPLFVVAKWIALAFSLCALLGCIFFLAATLRSFGSGSFSVPVFETRSFTRDQHSADNDIHSQKEKLGINNLYGNKILATITARGLTTIKVDDVVEFLLEEIPAERRAAFVNGWDAYLNKGMGFLQENKRLTDTAGDELTHLFQLSFLSALRNTEAEKQKAEDKRLTNMGVAALLAILFVMAMIVPFLAAIELNTRAQRPDASAALPTDTSSGD